VSPDARDGSLAIDQDVVIHSGLLDPGHHIAYELAPGRTVWIHLVSGVASLDEIVLSSGDSAGVSAEPRASLIAREATELLVIDLGSYLA
jgi:redox-sensitive bicupin YhaK (pirin superfamily)